MLAGLSGKKTMSNNSIDPVKILDDWPLWQITSCQPDDIQLEKISGGMTNQNYLLHLDVGRYVIRFDAKNSAELDIDRNAEYRIHQMAAEAGLVNPVIYRNTNTPRYWIREYIQGKSLSVEALKNELIINDAHPNDTHLNQIVSVLKTLHQIQPAHPLPTISLVDKAQQYIDIICQLKDVSGALNNVLNKLLLILAEAPDKTRCLCHMDATLNNWIMASQGLRLIDWEYAGLGHPLWDLATVSIDGQLNEQQQHKMLQQYYSNETWNLSHWQLAKQQISALAALWYGAQRVWDIKTLESTLIQIVDCPE